MEKKVTIGVVIFAVILLLVNIVILYDIKLSDVSDFFDDMKDKIEEKIEESKKINESELRLEVDDKYRVNESINASAFDNEYKKLFNTENIVKVNINMYKKNYEYLVQNAKEKPYVLADSLTIGDTTINNIGIKTKGNESLRKTELDKYSWSINTNKFLDKEIHGKQNLYGLKRISLNNMSEDTTFLKDYLSYYLMSELGLCTPYFSLAELSINNEYKGLYLLLENMEEELINRCYLKEDGFLAKPERFGGELTYIDQLNYLIGEDGNYSFDLKNYKDKKNVLRYYVGILEEKSNGEDITEDDFDEEKLTDELNLLFKWMKKMNMYADNTNIKNYEKEVEKIIDMENLIKYFAALTFLVDEDSYLGVMAHNYGLYIDENMYMNIIPWDFNLSFGNVNTTAEEMINHSIDNPLFEERTEERPLLKIILQNENYRKKYYKYLEDCTKIVMGGVVNGKTYEENNYINIINKMDKKIIDVFDEKKDSYTDKEHKEGIETLKELIKLRTKAVKEQLNGNYKKIETNLDISKLGRNPR